MSPMAAMSRAIREECEKYGRTLADLPDDVLNDFAAIMSAYLLDLRAEQGRRRD